MGHRGTEIQSGFQDNNILVGQSRFRSATVWCGIVGFRERVEVERLQLKYIKWTFGLDIRTLNYIVLEETKREKIRVRAGRRALSFEKGIRKGIGRLVLKECLKEKEEGRQKTRNMEESEGYLRRNGLSRLGLD
ncbi:hypothetical protein K0M31_016082 [Melipona bicolor]|uniref:Uncharacterized protein n=1 Tax=Melipona bicolor TaxID=60889 RepID=A0AA40KT88_9HYME|nr:hypothetical protein K0M31_016082 [Melipona bicolor]